VRPCSPTSARTMLRAGLAFNSAAAEWQQLRNDIPTAPEIA
jgi:hypothetical protein